MRILSRAGAAALLTFASAGTLSAATITVGVDQPTVAAAVAAATAGDTIVIPAGTYTGSTVTINKPITILGPKASVDPNGELGADGSRPLSGSRGTGEAVLNFGFSLNNGNAATQISNVTISGLTFSGLASTVFGQDDPQGCNNITISYNIVDNFAGQGFNRNQSNAPMDSVVFTRNRFTNYTGANTTAIWLSGSAVNTDLEISWNYFSDPDRTSGTRGFIVGGGGGTIVEYNTFYRLGFYAGQFADGGQFNTFRYNTVTATLQEGIRVLSGPSNNASQGAVISNNTFRDVYGDAIVFSQQSVGSVGPGAFNSVDIFNNDIQVNLDVAWPAVISGIALEMDPTFAALHSGLQVFRNNIEIVGCYIPQTVPVLDVTINGTTQSVTSIGAAQFGPTSYNIPATAVQSLAAPSLSCSPAAPGTYTGIALVDRGTCSFEPKVLNAQSGGATAVLLANNTTGVQSMAAAGTGGVTVPSVLITQQLGIDIRTALAASQPVTATLRSESVIYPAYGIFVVGGFSDLDIVNNAISFNTSCQNTGANPSAGIILSTDAGGSFGEIPGNAEILIADNVVDGNGNDVAGVLLYASPDAASGGETIINGNTITDTTSAILITGAADGAPVVTGNNFVNNDTVVDNNNAAGTPITGADNFFGTPDGSVPPGSFVGSAPTDLTNNSPFPIVPVDADGDGLSDYEETNVYGTLVNNPDTDGDGISDGIEISSGTNPKDNTSPGGSLADADNDLIPDTLEAILGLDATNPDENNDRILDGYALALTGSINGAVTLGDANSDGQVTNQDAIAILEAFLGVTFQSVAVNRDINRDGQVNNLDAVILYQWVLGNISYIPFP